MSPLPEHRLSVYRGRDGLWYWNVKARNHKVVDASEQGYRARWYATRKARRAYPDATLVAP